MFPYRSHSIPTQTRTDMTTDSIVWMSLVLPPTYTRHPSATANVLSVVHSILCPINTSCGSLWSPLLSVPPSTPHVRWSLREFTLNPTNSTKPLWPSMIARAPNGKERLYYYYISPEYPFKRSFSFTGNNKDDDDDIVVCVFYYNLNCIPQLLSHPLDDNLS